MKVISFALSFFLAIIFMNVEAQSLPTKIEQYQKNFPKEKLYLTIDKNAYSAGDTLWFKSILLNSNLTQGTPSDKIYIELFNDSAKLVERKAVMLNNGLGYGQFDLAPTLKDGTYTLRAYTNWMQNFGEHYFFQQSIYIGNATEKTWLVNSHQQYNNNTLELKLKLSNTKNEVAGLKDLDAYVLVNNSKKILQNSFQTSLQGLIETKIPITDIKFGDKYSLVLIDKKDKAHKVNVPLAIPTAHLIDLQFMPEGGYIVDGIFGKIAFKAIGSDGLGRNINGKIVNSKNEEVATFNTSHKGMGNFYLFPQPKESYTAVFRVSGVEKKQVLPLAKPEGTTLRVDHLSKKDSILVYIKASETKKMDGYQLVLQQSEELLLSVAINLKDGFQTLKLPKKDFPDGVIHLTLFSPTNMPLNERQVFIHQQRKITLALNPNQASYAPRDSISLALTAKDEAGNPVKGSFAVAVTDDLQAKPNTSHIAAYFLLQSELKGNIEEPEWYFQQNDDAGSNALDQLLLTQGWVGYQWEEINQPLAPKFIVEKDNVISGQLTNLFKKPVPNIKLTMISLKRNFFVTDTVSDSNGKFFFKDIPILDSAAFTIKIKNQKNRTSTANIMVNEFVPSALPITFTPITPWYINTDTSTLSYLKNVKTIAKLEDQRKMVLTGTTLKEVEIIGQKKLKLFNEKHAWDASIVKEIDEEQLKLIPRKSLLDLLKEKIPGFRSGILWKDHCSARTPLTHVFENYVVGNMLVSHVIIDGINTHLVSCGIPDNYNENFGGVSATATEADVFFTNKTLFENLSAADIKSISIYKGCAYYFLNITTRNGNGPWISSANGVYVYRPIPIHVGKDFYSPKYLTPNVTNVPDYRSTLFWDANVVTDENGKAYISFYAASSPSTYTVQLEGTDLQGRFGQRRLKLTVAPKTPSK